MKWLVQGLEKIKRLIKFLGPIRIKLRRKANCFGQLLCRVLKSGKGWCEPKVVTHIWGYH